MRLVLRGTLDPHAVATSRQGGARDCEGEPPNADDDDKWEVVVGVAEQGVDEKKTAESNVARNREDLSRGISRNVGPMRPRRLVHSSLPSDFLLT
jgi:hypothetical protein